MTAPGRTPVTIARAATTLGISERDIRRWITARLLSSYIPERGVTKKGTRVVILEDVVALDRKLRQQARHKTPRARLRREHVEAIAALQLDTCLRTPNHSGSVAEQRDSAGAAFPEALSEDPG